MNWTQLLKTELEHAYATAEKLLDKVDPQTLDWKPESGSNWMTTGQLLKHLTDSCGAGCRGFVTGDWGLPEEVKLEELSMEEMLPPAEKMPGIDSVEQTRELLSKDKALALEMIDRAGETDLSGKEMEAPWAPGVRCPLGQHLLHMIQHLDKHTSQLFYYLKLQGKPVSTPDLWG